jgi:hypothetical protein
MAYKDKEKQREFQRESLKKKRVAWLMQNGPCLHCGSWEDLEVDHKNPAEKVNHRIWSWSEPRRLAELAKCQVLCTSCHKAKTAQELSREITHGTGNGYKKGCRCDACREAVAKEIREWRWATGRRKRRE